jgi:hypothetical protein
MAQQDAPAPLQGNVKTIALADGAVPFAAAAGSRLRLASRPEVAGHPAFEFDPDRLPG